ncbi:thymidylate synthase [Paenibacillus sp. FSL R10-2199]|uniref:thymidylate synthase n=1 Tax=Paenibacillus sp. FSL R10-2199 TaxID=2975348 RepID=UPI0030F890C3
MTHLFSGTTANDVWCQAYNKLTGSENVGIVESRSGDTYELLHTVFSISNPRERWVTYRNPSISIAFALAEVIWILAGSNDSEIINFWNPPLQRYAGNGSIYHGAYGYRIRKRYGRDQFNDAYNTLMNNPNSRQAVMLIWNPEDDQPDFLGAPVSPDIPCNICSMLKIRNAKLEWTQILRSNDIYRGVPYNFIQFTMLQEILAGWLNVELGLYTHFSDSLHLYESDLSKLSILQNSTPPNQDNLMLDKQTSSKLLDEIFNKMRVISTGDIKENVLCRIASLNSGYQAYDNIMFIIAAYAARRYGYKELKNHLINNCQSDLYKHLWNSWEKTK